MADAPQDQIAPLLNPEGWELLASLGPYREDEAFRLNASLRKAGHSPELVSAVLTQSRLRTKAEAKFGEFARQMIFTQAGLEQATRLTVAARHAQRFAEAGVQHVADLGCGLGADAMALASLDITVTAVEMDETTAACATMNLIPFRNATVVHSDATTVALDGIDGVWLDPARRTTSTSGTKRIWDPEDFSPPLSFVESLAGAGLAVGVKMGPGMPHDSVPKNCEAQWVSVGGDVTEVALWFNAVRRPGIRRAALLLGPAGAAELSSPEDFDGGPAAPVGPVEGYLYEPDGAVIRAGLVADVALQLGGHLVDEHIAYICAPELRDTPFARAYKVLDVMPYNVKALKAWVKDQGIGVLDIKKRGTSVTPEELRKQLLPGGRVRVRKRPPWSSPGSARSGWPFRWSRSRAPVLPGSGGYWARMKSSAAWTCSSLGRIPVYSTNCSSAWMVATSAPVITVLPAARAALTSGVSAGSATTSNTTFAASTASRGKDRESASGPPAIPTGVTLMIMSAPATDESTSARQAKPYSPASALPASSLRAITVTSRNPASRSAAAVALAMPPAPFSRTE